MKAGAMPDKNSISEEEIFLVAAAMSSKERAAYVNSACDGHPTLKQRVERLLASHESDGFMEEDVSPSIQARIARLVPEDIGDNIGPYRLLQEIGHGGFGVVWMVEQSHPVRRRVALKIVKLGMDTKEVVARFEQERQALAVMDHPNIARVFDAGVTPSGRPYFVMELVRGTKLTEFCDEHDLSTTERLELFVRICHAVHHAHQKGIIHRDLKPSNILVGMVDGVPMPKIIDFGVAKATQSRIGEHSLYTEIGQIIGTPLYMSPEQAETTTLDIDTRSDVYSLGVLLYELLTGHTPFTREQMEQNGVEGIRKIIREQEPQRPSTALGTIAPEALAAVARHRHTEAPHLVGILKRDLDWIVMRAIEKDRNRRYDSATAMAEDIERHLRSEPVVARPPTIGYRTRRLVMRNKGAFVTAAIVSMALVLGTGVSVWQAVRANENARRANQALSDLRQTAPAFAAMARELAATESWNAAIDKLDYAIRLQPGNASFRLYRADLFQAQGRLTEAAADYRAALDAAPDDRRARNNLALCEKLLARPVQPDGSLSRETLAELLNAVSAEKRPAAETMPLARRLGRENEFALAHWQERLRSLPNPTEKSIDARIEARSDGFLSLDLRDTGIADLSPLQGMPLGELNLSGCNYVRDIEALRDAPLRVLNLEHTSVSDLSPLATTRALYSLNLNHTPASDLGPLATLPLRLLWLVHGEVRDLTPLRGLPLEHLVLGNARGVGSLAPLAELPLKLLDCSYTNITDFSPLAKVPLRQLWLQGTTVGDLSFLRAIPLETLVLTKARNVTNFAALSEVKTLKELALPEGLASLPESELDAIEGLRNHPALQRLSSQLPEGEVPAAAKSTGAFWAAWDADTSWQRALRKMGIKANIGKRPDGTWSVMTHSQPLPDLAVFKGGNIGLLDVSSCSEISDLSPLITIPVKTLRIANTKVTDLSPLKGTKVEDLWMSNTDITDLTPLASLPLRALYMDKSKAPVDFAPLANLETLEELILPEHPSSVEKLRALPRLRYLSFTFDSKTYRPSRTAAEFWAEWDSFTWLPKLKGLDFTIAQLSSGIAVLVIRDPAFRDLSVLADSKINALDLRGSGVTDLTPLAGMSTLRNLIIPKDAVNVAALRKNPAIERISATGNQRKYEPAQTAEEFWREQDGN